MNPQFEPFSQIVDLSQNLGAAVLGGAEELTSFQLDHVQAFITRSSKQLRTSLSDARKAGEPGQWPEVFQQSIAGANAMLRDAFVSSLDYEMEMFRLLRKQAAEAQQLISDTVSEQVAAIESSVVGTRGKRSAKSGAFTQKLAA